MSSNAEKYDKPLTNDSSKFPFACLTRSLYLTKPKLSLLLILSIHHV